MEYPWRSVHTRILCNLREVLAKHFREDSAKWIWCFWQKKVMPTWANGIRNSAIKDRQNTENQRRNSFECWIFWVKKTVSGTLSACFFYCRQYSFSLIYGIFRGLKREFSHDTAVFSFIMMKLNSVSTKFYSVRTSFYVHTYEKYFCTYVPSILTFYKFINNIDLKLLFTKERLKFIFLYSLHSICTVTRIMFCEKLKSNRYSTFNQTFLEKIQLV